MQTETTMRNHLIPIRMTIIRKSTNNKCQRECGEKETLLHCWWVCKLVQPLWRTVWRFLEKLKIELSYDPAIPLLGIYPEKNHSSKDTYTLVFTASLFTVTKIWKQLNVHQQMNGYKKPQHHNSRVALPPRCSWRKPACSNKDSAQPIHKQF